MTDWSAMISEHGVVDEWSLDDRYLGLGFVLRVIGVSQALLILLLFLRNLENTQSKWFVCAKT